MEPSPVQPKVDMDSPGVHMDSPAQPKVDMDSLGSHKLQDMPQLLNKKPTQDTTQNHMHIKKKVAECQLKKIQDTSPTTRLSQVTRQAPGAKRETNT